MSEQASLVPVLRFFKEVVNQHDASLLENIVTPQVREYDLTEALIAATAQTPPIAGKTITTVFPDLHDHIEAIVATDTHVAVRVYGTGTHSAELFGIPATRKPLAWTATMVWQVHQGRIQARWMAFDFLSQMIQLGAIPSVQQVRLPVKHLSPLLPKTRDAKGRERVDGDILRPVQCLIEALRTGNVAELEDVIALDFIDHGGWIDGLPTGPEGLRQEIALLRQAFPNLTITVEHLFGDGEQVALCLTGVGTHRGELFGVPATNKRVTWMTVGIYRIEQGKIKERWLDGTRFELLRQLGVLSSIPFEWLTKLEWHA